MLPLVALNFFLFLIFLFGIEPSLFYINVIARQLGYTEINPILRRFDNLLHFQPLLTIGTATAAFLIFSGMFQTLFVISILALGAFSTLHDYIVIKN